MRAPSLRASVLALALVGIVGAACGDLTTSSASPASQAWTDCLGYRSVVTESWGQVRGVAGAFSVPASDVVAWQETRSIGSGIRPTSLFRSHGTQPLLVCFFDGDFDHFPGKGRRPPYDRIVVIFGQDGKPVLDSAGPQDYLTVERPGPRP